MWEFFLWLFMAVLLVAGAAGGIVLVRGYRSGTPPRELMFGPRDGRRLEVVEQANLDGRRRLVLIRRDHVEHLLMTGGPVDVVIEINIHPGYPRRTVDEGASANGFRPPAP